MAEIRITGFDKIETLAEESLELSRRLYALQKKQPEKTALINAITTMQGMLERLIAAHEKLADGKTDESIEARHALNACNILLTEQPDIQWRQFDFPPEPLVSGQVVRLVKKSSQPAKKAPAKKKPAAKKKAPAKKGKRK